MTIAFAVFGKPQSAGSKQAYVPTDKQGQPFRGAGGRIIVNVVDDNPKSKDWKRLVADVAQHHRPSQLIDGPVRLTLTFQRERNKGHFNSKGVLNKEGLSNPFPTAKPDVLKLARAVEDALTGIIWKDDAQIVDERLYKVWGDAPCVAILIEELTPAVG